MLALFRERWPTAFNRKAWPLKIGVGQEIRNALAGDEVSALDITIALRSWTQRVGYLSLLADGKRRISLEGFFGEAPTDDEREHAGALLKKALARKAGREATAKKAGAPL
jgi:sRNA-binding protein